MKSPTLWMFVSLSMVIGSLLGLCVLDSSGTFILLLIIGSCGLALFARASWKDIDQMTVGKSPQGSKDDFE